MKKLLLTAFAAMLLVSCNKDIDTLVNLGNSGKLTIRASIADLQTKTTVVYGNSDYSQGETSQWSTGDEILIRFTPTSGGNPQDIKFVLTNGANTTTAEFAIAAGQMPPAQGEYDIKAIYPANAVGGVDFNNQTQTGFNANHIGEYDIMEADASAVTIEAVSSDIDLSFRHSLPMLRFSLKNRTGNDIEIQKISIRSNHDNNSFLDYAYTSIIYYPPFYSNATEVFIQCLNTTITSANTDSHDFYMMLAGNSVEVEADLIVSVQFTKDDVSNIRYIQKFTIPASEVDFLDSPFEAGKRYYFQLAVTNASIITEYEENGLIYELNIPDKTAVLVDGRTATGTVTIPATVHGDYKIITIEDGAFWNSAITGLDFASNSELKYIGEVAFSNCYSLASIITIPAKVTSIGDGAFYYSAITGLAFASGSELTDIGSSAFGGCTDLSGTINIPATVISIGNEAFYDTTITEVTIGSSSEGSLLATIGDNAFGGTHSISTVNMYCPTPPTLGNTVFYKNTSAVFTVHVPSSAVTAYNAGFVDPAKGWNITGPLFPEFIASQLSGAARAVITADLN